MINLNFLIALFFSSFCFSQSILINPEGKPESTMEFPVLTRELLQTECLNIGFVTVLGAQNHGGYFEKGSSDFPFERGIILSTGEAGLQSGPNTSFNETTAEPFSGGDLVIKEILDVRSGNMENTQNIISTRFDFIPQTNEIKFRYIFASESYQNAGNIECNNGNNSLQDGFAFILKGPGIVPDTYDHDADPTTPEIEFLHGGKNIALLDDGITEVGLHTIHNNSFCTNLGRDDLFQEIPIGSGAITSDGMTVPLTASSLVVPGEAYSLEIVLANRGNFILDSSLFVEAVEPALEPSLDSTYNICTDIQGNAIVPVQTVETGLGGLGYNFRWFLDNSLIANEIEPSLSILEAGQYRVEVTGLSGCSNDYAFIVTSSTEPGDISYELSGEVFTGNQNLTIIVEGGGEYLYQVSGFDVQESPVFNRISPGQYIVTVSDIRGCGNKEMEIEILDFPKFFTPNNDGINDFWNINFMDIGIGGEISIFDRYGSLIATTSSSENGWDGTFKGRPMPSSDYWFVLRLDDGFIFKNHFSLKR